jgi:hypothetical protein
MFKDLESLSEDYPDNKITTKENKNKPSNNFKRVMKETFQSVMEGSMYFLYGNYNAYCRINKLEKMNDDSFLGCMEEIRGVDDLKKYLEDHKSNNNVYQFFYWYLFEK